jgi:hypothetical protein
MQEMRSVVATFNAYQWAGEMLADADRLRGTQQRWTRIVRATRACFAHSGRLAMGCIKLAGRLRAERARTTGSAGAAGWRRETENENTPGHPYSGPERRRARSAEDLKKWLAVLELEWDAIQQRDCEARQKTPFRVSADSDLSFSKAGRS